MGNEKLWPLARNAERSEASRRIPSVGAAIEMLRLRLQNDTILARRCIGVDVACIIDGDEVRGVPRLGRGAGGGRDHTPVMPARPTQRAAQRRTRLNG